MYINLDSCIICNNDSLVKYIDFGFQPLANNLHDNKYEIETYPLAVNVCPKCFHSQLSVSVSPILLFNHYLYMTGMSDTIIKYFKWFVKYSTSFFDNGELDVLDIASNDGTLLKQYLRQGHNVQGVDPAKNLVEIANNNNINTYCGFWNNDTLNVLKPKKFDIIIAMNVFAHITYPKEFLKLCVECLKENGLIFIQTSQADIFKNNEFDTIYHEHISFFTLRSFKVLLDQLKLNIVDFQKPSIHGNSYLLVISKNTSISENFFNNYMIEEYIGYYDINTYHKFNEFINIRISQVKNYINSHNDLLKLGFGCAAKGNVFLNCSNIKLDAIIDETPTKIGKFSPGMNIPIVGLEYLDTIKDKEIIILILAWNYFDEIKNKLSNKLKDCKITFIKYFPEFQVTIKDIDILNQ